MINFRYHLVSLVAVFLALAVGIVMGSTVIDRAIVDGLRNRIDQVEANADARREENQRLESEMSRLDRYIDASAPFAVTDRLRDRDVMVFALAGTDEAPLREAVDLIRVAGGRTSGIVWIEDDWTLEDEDVLQQVAAIAGVVSTDPKVVRTAAWEDLATAMQPVVANVSDPVDPTTEPPVPTTVPATSPDLVDQLIRAGVLRFETVGDGNAVIGPLAGTDVLVVANSQLNEDSAALLLTVLQSLARSDVPTVAAEVFRTEKGGADRGDGMAVVHDDRELAAAVSTVDAFELVEGRVAAVLALSDAQRGVIGRYGYGPDTQPLPEWSQP